MKRLVNSASSELVRVALESGRAERPSSRARERTAAVLGLGVGAGVGVVSMTARAAVASSKAAASGSVVHASVFAALRSMPLAMKVLSVGVAAGALATTTVVLQQRAPRELSSPTAKTATAIREPAGPTGNQAPTAHDDLPVAPAETPPQAPTSRADKPEPLANRTPAAASGASAERSDDLSLGVSVLQLARSAISEGDTPRALRIVSEYERQFPKGELREEAAIIRIEALIAGGANAEALEAANKFLSTAPNSPHARHVRAMAESLRESNR